MRRKLIITFISISFLILAVGTTTWAYVNNLYSDVSNIEITAQGDLFTEMSVDGINYSVCTCIMHFAKTTTTLFKIT